MPLQIYCLFNYLMQQITRKVGLQRRGIWEYLEDGGCPRWAVYLGKEVIAMSLFWTNYSSSSTLLNRYLSWGFPWKWIPSGNGRYIDNCRLSQDRRMWLLWLRLPLSFKSQLTVFLCTTMLYSCCLKVFVEDLLSMSRQNVLIGLTAVLAKLASEAKLNCPNLTDSQKLQHDIAICRSSAR